MRSNDDDCMVCLIVICVFGLIVSGWLFMAVASRNTEVVEQGKAAAVHNIPEAMCPYSGGTDRVLWMRGYIDGLIAKTRTAEVEQ